MVRSIQVQKILILMLFFALYLGIYAYYKTVTRKMEFAILLRLI